ncbi:porin [Pseudomonas sp. S60]|uniref:carbohydrate porin n=1 Tax=unclassified Pseudomonas TaxID=196821 RepID=UPI001913DEEA|nr:MULTISPECIES: carbohydrate porin [unclassified Pseudomonas]MBK5006358.1 porin [Pseudomonas sp. S32]MBK5009477.1 porin [Pseudomonas sp. S60]
MYLRHTFTTSTLSILALINLYTPQALAHEPLSPSSPWMLGDWNGSRGELADQGVDLEFSYLSEIAANVHGGASHHTARYADQWSAGAKLDLSELLSWKNAEAEIRLSNRNGRGLDEDALNDRRVGGFGATQEIHGRGSVTRLSQFWLSKGWIDNKLNVKIGRFTVGDEFATADCAFQNLSFCGSQPGNYVNDIYNSPISSWAVRLQYALADDLVAKIAAYNVDPSSLDNDNGLKLRTHGTSGTMVPVELVWTPRIGKLPGEYRVGYFKNTVNRPDVLNDVNGQPAALTQNQYRVHDGRSGWWLNAKQQISSKNNDQSRGLVLAASLSFQDQATTPVDSYMHISLVYKGPFDFRPLDQLGLGLSRVHASDQYLENAQFKNQVNGVYFDSPSYIPEQHTSYQAELNYRIQATNWLHLMPNIQYIRNPGNVREVENAVVIGLQVGSSF